MAHFAKLNQNNEVIAVHCVNNDVLNIDNEEESGIAFLTTLHQHILWKQTSYNNKFRKQFAGVTYKYDPINDVFIAPQPYPSWLLDDNFDWQAPKPKPQDGHWYWNESEGDWHEFIS